MAEFFAGMDVGKVDFHDRHLGGGDGIAQQQLHLRWIESRQPVTETSHRPSLQSAGSDLVKSRQIARHVQSQSVLGDPATASDADSGDFAVVEPAASNGEVEQTQACYKHHYRNAANLGKTLALRCCLDPVGC